MNYVEAWNKIVGYYEKHDTALEAMIQTVWEDCVFSAILNYDMTEIDSQRAVQMGSTKKMDIVVRKDGKDAFVAELKRHTARASDGGQAQLFSYLNQLKSVDIGILVCNKLYIYDYDFTKQNEENEKDRLEIPFERDNLDGIKFVELFSKENFNSQNIKEYIKARRKSAENKTLILEEISETLVRIVLKKYFMERFSEEDVEIALDKIDISMSIKKRQSHVHSSTITKSYEDKEIKIKGHTFDLYMNPQHGDMLFQDFVKRTFTDLLEWDLIPIREIEKLQQRDYSKETFDLQYALLQKDKNKCVDATGKQRYWTKKIGTFYICSQWWKEKVDPVYANKFAEWLRYLSRICDNG